MTEDRWEIFGDYDEDRKFNEGVKYERERIIELLGQDINEQDDWFEMRYDHMIALINGEN